MMRSTTPERPRILVVEDDAAVRTQLRWTFADDYDVETASTQSEALALAESLRPGVITLDLSLLGRPGETEEGFDILPVLHAMDPQMKIIIVTASDDLDRAARALALGAFDYYVKPIDRDELRVVVQRAFRLRGIEGHARRSGNGAAAVPGMIGVSPGMLEAFSWARQAVGSSLPVLIAGEPGTGRQRLANAIHRLSPRADGPFEILAGGTLADALARGRGGTVLVADASLTARVERDLRELLVAGDGGADVRIILCADSLSPVPGRITRRETGGTERACDLVECIRITLPPLRDRDRDVVLLAESFASRFAGDRSGRTPAFTRSAVRALLAYEWPGNIPELINRVRRAAESRRGGRITPGDLGLVTAALSDRTLGEARSELEREMVMEAMRRSGGNVSHAARAIGVSRPTMYDLLRKLGVDPGEYKGRA